MLPNSQNNSLQVKRILSNKIKEIPNVSTVDETKTINELREIFAHSKTFVNSRTNTHTPRQQHTTALSQDRSTRSSTSSLLGNTSTPELLGLSGDMQTEGTAGAMSIGSNSYTHIYPFITETISPSIDETLFDINKHYNIHVCIYRVFDSAKRTIPFLQFKLQIHPKTATKIRRFYRDHRFQSIVIL